MNIGQVNNSRQQNFGIKFPFKFQTEEAEMMFKKAFPPENFTSIDFSDISVIKAAKGADVQPEVAYQKLTNGENTQHILSFTTPKNKTGDIIKNLCWWNNDNVEKAELPKTMEALVSDVDAHREICMA